MDEVGFLRGFRFRRVNRVRMVEEREPRHLREFDDLRVPSRMMRWMTATRCSGAATRKDGTEEAEVKISFLLLFQFVFFVGLFFVEKLMIVVCAVFQLKQELGFFFSFFLSVSFGVGFRERNGQR